MSSCPPTTDFLTYPTRDRVTSQTRDVHARHATASRHRPGTSTPNMRLRHITDVDTPSPLPYIPAPLPGAQSRPRLCPRWAGGPGAQSGWQLCPRWAGGPERRAGGGCARGGQAALSRAQQQLRRRPQPGLHPRGAAGAARPPGSGEPPPPDHPAPGSRRCPTTSPCTPHPGPGLTAGKPGCQVPSAQGSGRQAPCAESPRDSS